MKAARRTREESRLPRILRTDISARVKILGTIPAPLASFPCKLRVNNL